MELTVLAFDVEVEKVWIRVILVVTVVTLDIFPWSIFHCQSGINKSFEYMPKEVLRERRPVSTCQ